LTFRSSSNYLKIRPERKWASLLDNWRESVFGSSSLEQLGLHDRWNRIAAYMNRKKNFEDGMRRNFMLVNKSTSTESLELEEMQSLPSLPTMGRSNSELWLKGGGGDDFDTASLRSFSDYSLASDSIINRRFKQSQQLDFVPAIVQSAFTTLEAIDELKEYVMASISNENHPFCSLIGNIRRAFSSSYGNWKCKPTSILSRIAMDEWISIIKRIYAVLRMLFPGLPSETDADEECKLLSPLNFLHQILLDDEIYSSVFLLYASKSSRQDELYSQRLMTCERKSNEELRQLLKIEPELIVVLEDRQFSEAIAIFQRISQKFCPSEMLDVIRDTFETISSCAVKVGGKTDLLSADNLLSVTIYLLVKANVNHLGAELSLLTDLMDDDIDKLINMEQYIYTTIKIAYLHTISTRFFQN